MADEELINLRLRTRLARVKAELGQMDVATHLGIERNTYASYESRDKKSKRSMPRRHMAKFCEVTNTNERWLLTGSGPARKDGEGGSLSELIKVAYTEFRDDPVMLSLLEGVRARAKEAKK